ncbi:MULTISPECIES: F0F1 ATP synthase subunit delta [Rhodococcus]|jgi:F-type H+-transporting ATPase subunit delta|nr:MULTISPECIES: F0F1 ATP synthase subunit delta [Rhodococcus]MDV7245951.1 F0F1 ATP synthase subunit delta [Rhodococcus oxybenzonivorans]MDV7265282.1 F0F1 ATP synthase subunit delta [Rhodococcus oxybenzonivorans]MDV7277245.1 F0F1 ATP synthase subunit delta [Rhodococcus oxybenzonivorans]MDV7336815.1 F0F1 ATP synthase subunit delta [Rhodococcus oxybenzonivorans]MDV7346957.1 F0F1 ATP synthase subunit delta [Rhodococcus oxybenzonivorans]
MYAASREALTQTRAALSSALGSVSAGAATAAAAQTGAELFTVVETLDVQRTLRSALADNSAAGSAREGLAEQVFGGKVSAETLATVKAAVGQNWSTTSDLLNSLVLLGRESLLKAAADQGQLDGVEDELFRLGRIVAGDPTLEQALSDRSVSAKAKRDLLSKLLYGKVTAVTEALAVQAVGRLKSTAPADAFDALANLAAARREAVVAKVRSASTLSSEQTDRLAAALTRTYGKPVTVHVEVDPELLSGLVVRVGDEVIDGSAAGRLAALRKSLK